MDLQPHPLSSGYPLMQGEEYEALKASIKAHGLRLEIWLYDGQIIDGRNRYRACKELGIDFEYRTFRGTEAEAKVFADDLNLHRRHLPDAATRRETVYRLRTQGLSTRKIAAAVGVSQKQVHKDLKVKPTVDDRSSTVGQNDTAAKEDHEPGECCNGDEETSSGVGVIAGRSNEAGCGGSQTPAIGRSGRDDAAERPVPPATERVTGRDGKSYPATKKHKKPAGKPATAARSTVGGPMTPDEIASDRVAMYRVGNEVINLLKSIPTDSPHGLEVLLMVRNYITANLPHYQRVTQ